MKNENMQFQQLKIDRTCHYYDQSCTDNPKFMLQYQNSSSYYFEPHSITSMQISRLSAEIITAKDLEEISALGS